MPVNKNALLRYRTIDNCLRNTRRRWTLDDLIDACSDDARFIEDRKFDPKTWFDNVVGVTKSESDQPQYE